MKHRLVCTLGRSGITWLLVDGDHVCLLPASMHQPIPTLVVAEHDAARRIANDDVSPRAAVAGALAADEIEFDGATSSGHAGGSSLP